MIEPPVFVGHAYPAGPCLLVPQNGLPTPEPVSQDQPAKHEVLETSPRLDLDGLLPLEEGHGDPEREIFRILLEDLDIIFHFGQLANPFINFLSLN